MQPLALRSSLLAVVAAVSLAGASHAQGHSVVPPAKITIGDGFSSSGTFNGTDHDPFVDALDFLADEGQGFGGQIEVLAGVYTFTSKVDVTLDGVRIYGAQGAVLKRSGSGLLLDVTGDGFALDGLTLLDDRSTAHGLVRIAGDTPSITGCAFELATGVGSDTAWAIQLDGGSEAVDGGLVQGNVFRFGGDAVGRGALSAAQCRSLRIHGNSFTRSINDPVSDYHGAIDLEKCAWTVLAANTFNGLSDPDQDTPAVRSWSNAGANSTAVLGNYFEVTLGASMLHFE